MALRAKWQFMDRSVTHKIVYGPQLRFGPYTILWVTSRSINCHMALSAMNYLINVVWSTPRMGFSSLENITLFVRINDNMKQLLMSNRLLGVVIGGLLQGKHFQSYS